MVVAADVQAPGHGDTFFDEAGAGEEEQDYDFAMGAVEADFVVRANSVGNICTEADYSVG